MKRLDALIMEFVEKFYSRTEAMIFKLYFISGRISNSHIAKIMNVDEDKVSDTIRTIITDIRSRLEIELIEEEDYDPNPHNEDFTIEENNNERTGE